MGNGRREGYWRQTDVRVEGPVANDLQAAFAENWLEATGRLLAVKGKERREKRQEVKPRLMTLPPSDSHAPWARPVASMPPARSRS
jgi:phosphatidylserine/phosphatidylglycerophosphate/cardiolipin synthase-like enzyme